MQTISISAPPMDAELKQRAIVLFQDDEHELHKYTDQLFAKVMIIQWVVGVVAALWMSPLAWIGDTIEIHIHVWAVVLLGGANCGLPVSLAWLQPSHTLMCHVVSASQMLISALLIQLTTSATCSAA